MAHNIGQMFYFGDLLCRRGIPVALAIRNIR